jgi:hypothetical protein
MVEVLIEEMLGSDRSRPIGYTRAVVVDEEASKNKLTPLLWSERTSLLKKCLTGPTLLEMSGFPTNRDFDWSFQCAVCESSTNKGTRKRPSICVVSVHVGETD